MNWKPWLKGLISAIASSIAGGEVVKTFNPTAMKDWDSTWKTCLVLGIWGGAMYLIKSPFPPDIVVETTVKTVEGPRPSDDVKTTTVREIRKGDAVEAEPPKS